VLRPIDSSISILTAEERANQIKDPSAHHAQTLQQDEIAKRTQREAQSVQPADKTDEDVKIRDRKEDRNKDGRRNKKKKNSSDDAEERGDESKEKPRTAAASGRFEFLA
jgi:hypothetical protein